MSRTKTNGANYLCQSISSFIYSLGIHDKEYNTLELFNVFSWKIA